MTLLDRFRRRPRWEDPDPEVRANAVREIKSEDHDLLEQLARNDADPRVRRAAVRRLGAPAALAAIATGDADLGVREQAASALMGLAMGEDDAAAGTALAALSETRHLVALARSAPLAAVRRSALARITEARPMATLAKAADDAAIRMEALRRLEDPALVAEVALKSEHKDVALAALDRIQAPEDLEAVAARGKNRAAARRARARVEALAPKAVPPPEPSAAETPAPYPPLEALSAARVEVEEPAAAEPAPPPAEVEVGPANALVEKPAEPAPAEVRAHHDEVTARHAEPREHDSKETLARLASLCARMEGLLKSEPLALRDADTALREARAAHDALGKSHGREVGPLARRLKTARAALYARAQELREADDWSRWANATIQEDLCRLLESFAGRSDLEQVARELHAADQRWAEARTVPREQAEALRQRYQAARGPLKARLDEHFAAKAAQEAENRQRREDLCARAETLADSTEWLKAADELKALQARWKQIGPTSRKASQALWKRFRAACDRFFTRREEDLRKRKLAWSANLARKQELCAKAEALADSTDWEPTAAAIRHLQAEWKTVGAVARKRSEEVWQRFRKACDAFFERYKNRDQLELAGKRAAREVICRELEELLPAEEARGPAPENLQQKAQELQSRLRQGTPLPPQHEQALQRRFQDALSRLVGAWPESFRGTDLDPEALRAKKEKLCARVEALLRAGAPGEAPLSGQALADRLKEALATNTIGGKAEAEARQRAELEEVEAAEAAWKRLAPIPGEAGAALEDRFRKACARFHDLRRPSPRARVR